MTDYDDAQKRRDPDGILTFNTTGYVETVGRDDATPLKIKFGTFLCPHCDKTHVTVFMCDEDGEPQVQIAWKMDAQQSENMAKEFINPSPLSPEHVTYVPNNKGGH